MCARHATQRTLQQWRQPWQGQQQQGLQGCQGGRQQGQRGQEGIQGGLHLRGQRGPQGGRLLAQRVAAWGGGQQLTTCLFYGVGRVLRQQLPCVSRCGIGAGLNHHMRQPFWAWNVPVVLQSHQHQHQPPAACQA